MDIIPITKIIRIKRCHLDFGRNLYVLRDVEKELEARGFDKAADDGFFASYEHKDYKNENRNTIVTIGHQESVFSIVYAVYEPE